jgi:DNA polymerase III delta prime subunit
MSYFEGKEVICMAKYFVFVSLPTIYELNAENEIDAVEEAVKRFKEENSMSDTIIEPEVRVETLT